ncbi:antigen WC1.1-like [Cyprinus carpio]|uniref:Antigen WC1.1-like n=1 Tax=Cyprinus carpio TaxID=7962 RepID=A0A9Q9WMV6_CYPCA|nr:antigen WC1.1-like [Cyprinus carpio]
MDEVKCTSKEESLWKCPYVDITKKEQCDESSFVAVECSGEVTLSLNLNGQQDVQVCAGVVEFTTANGIIGVCNKNWDRTKANKICQELGCGDHHYIPKPGMFKEQTSKKNVLLNCVSDEKFSWQCMEWAECQERASVICSNHKRFSLRDGSNACSGLVEEYSSKKKSWDLQQTNVRPEVICTQLNCGSTGSFTKANGNNRLTCSDSVKLHNFTTECFGDVSIDVNGTYYGVCYSNLDSIQSREKMGAVVCRELGCGDIVRVKQGSSDSNGLLSNVDCQGDERSLWHCLAIREKKQCLGTKVICSGSLDVRLRDGLGRCSGRVEVKWEGSWRSIHSDSATLISDMVCQHLNCGAPSEISRELFIEGEKDRLEWLWNVRCRSSSAKLHECFYNTDLRSPDQSEKNIEIICKKEELKFFEGNSPCKGKVCIEKFDGNKPDWLPAKPVEENKKKATDICSAMQCGSLVSFETEQNTTYAKVTCSGSKRVEPRVALQNPFGEKCWGMVKVCGDGKCGGVCSNTWRTNDSKTICENLDCGNPIRAQLPLQINNLPATYRSVYCSEKVQNMNMCNFIPNKNSTCKPLAQVICTDSVKAKLEDPRDKCAGKALLFYGGKWTPICQDSLDANLKNVICKELFCGESINDQHDLKSESTGLSKIKCPASANSVSKCDLKEVSEKECIVGYLKCTEWERLLLYNKKSACSGPVYGLRDGKTQLVGSSGWGREEGQILCKYLQCGNYISHSNITKNTDEWWKKTYDCSGKKNIWECETNDQSNQTQQLNIQCDSKPRKILLSDNCTGYVFINKEHVCASWWDDGMSNKLCDSLNCGKALHSWVTESVIKTNTWHFSCTGKETLMWQCGSRSDSCKKILSVACKGSVEFSSTEKCGGKLGIRYKGQWEYVCGELAEADTKKVCDVLNCNNQELLDEEKIAKEIKVKIECPKNHYNIFQCMHHLGNNTCSNRPAEIKCEGYTPKGGNSSVGLILGLLGVVLGLLILFLMWRNRKRLLLTLTHYRNKNGKDVNPDVNEMDQMDTEDRGILFNLIIITLNISGEEDEDDRKRGSSGTEYDDIEEQASGIFPSQTHHDEDLDLPLLPKRPENILDQDTYEVETEKQEDYDDVIPVVAAANENAGMTGTRAHVDVDVDEGADSDLDAGSVADVVLVTTEVEVHAQAE